jgi:hypothetical protein
MTFLRKLKWISISQDMAQKKHNLYIAIIYIYMYIYILYVYIYMSENSLTMSNLILEVGPMLTSAPWPSPKISVFDIRLFHQSGHILTNVFNQCVDIVFLCRSNWTSTSAPTDIILACLFDADCSTCLALLKTLRWQLCDAVAAP